MSQDEREEVPIEDLVRLVLLSRGPLTHAELTRIVLGTAPGAANEMGDIMGRMMHDRVRRVGRAPDRRWVAR